MYEAQVSIVWRVIWKKVRALWFQMRRLRWRFCAARALLQGN
jgi:hypothetical protein